MQLWSVQGALPPLRQLLSRRLDPQDPAFAGELDEAEKCIVQYLAKVAHSPIPVRGPPFHLSSPWMQIFIVHRMQVREADGVEAQHGIDTLLALLLSNLHMTAPLLDLVRGPNHVRVDEVERSLRHNGDSHALALLLANNHRVAEALDIWQVRAPQSCISPRSDQPLEGFLASLQVV